MDDVIAAGTSVVLTKTDDVIQLPDPGSLPVVVVAVRHRDGATCDAADLVIDPSDDRLDAVLENIARHPLAATSLAVLLRSALLLPVDAGLAAESAVYSLLQSGPEFARWRAGRTASTPGQPTEPLDDRPPVAIERCGGELSIELDRPQRHNAFTRAMRDALVEALALAATDDTIDHVRLSGRGPSFCSGGDRAEFGSFDDPASAHRTRLTRSPARLLHAVATRTTAVIHGNCLGAGIELPAFAGRVVAHRDAVIGLPEISLGLIPGAGGTVSLPRRIGRQRTALLALCGRPITAATALQWRLVDELA